MKEKKKVRIEEFVYMLIVICVVVFLFYSDCMDKYLYTLDAVKIVKNCLYIFLGGGTVISSFRFCWFRCEQGIVKKSIFFIGKIIVVIGAWRLILLYFCVYCIYRGLENKDTVKRYGNFVEFIIANAIELTVFWATFFLINGRTSTCRAKESQCRVRSYLISNLCPEVMLTGLILVFTKEQNLDMIASEIDVRSDFLIIPFLIAGWMYIVKKIVRICIWCYDWEQMYGEELKEKGIAPNIETVPFPK